MYAFLYPQTAKKFIYEPCDRNAIFFSTELISYNFHDARKTAAEQSIDEDKTKFCNVTTNKVF